mmetsp:Transcript_37889/g.89017  ORF Transcript_37889/g.89017 Transcript_37889/m.89017 type:complete len:221 (-) Transcript_37889:1693-2355(-)
MRVEPVVAAVCLLWQRLEDEPAAKGSRHEGVGASREDNIEVGVEYELKIGERPRVELIQCGPAVVARLHGARFLGRQLQRRRRTAVYCGVERVQVLGDVVQPPALGGEHASRTGRVVAVHDQHLWPGIPHAGQLATKLPRERRDAQLGVVRATVALQCNVARAGNHRAHNGVAAGRGRGRCTAGEVQAQRQTPPRPAKIAPADRHCCSNWRLSTPLEFRV